MKAMDSAQKEWHTSEVANQVVFDASKEIKHVLSKEDPPWA